MYYGRAALIDLETLPTPEDVPILPGATHVFKLHEDYVKGWNWYRTRVEKKPHPKKIAIEFSALSFGDGTGFLRTDGMPVPKKESSYGEKKGRETAKIKDNRLLLRPPDVRSQFSSSFLPAAFLQV
jgi:hypothetical protein